MTDETLEQAQQRYIAAVHAVQSGVSAKMALDPTEVEPKHLRVGVNSALVGDRALVELLAEKGILTAAEYFSKAADCMEEERDHYTRDLRQHFGHENIDLR